MLVSSAQNLEDIVLWRALGGVGSGTYVDVGAADPELDSVTKLFYDRGWSGINIEPVNDLADRLDASRSRDLTVRVCAGPVDGQVTLHQVEGTGLSTLIEQLSTEAAADGYTVESIQVPMRRLDAILIDAGYEGRPIHFLKIDAEGYEGPVLEGIDLAVWRPWVIMAEATYPRSTAQSFESWEPLVVENGYEFCMFDGLNRFYVAKEHAELRESLSYPACVFDQPFATAEHGRLLASHDEAVRTVEELRAEHGRLATTCAAFESECTKLAAQISLMGEEIVALNAQHEEQRHEAARLAGEISSALTAIVDERAARQMAERELSEIRGSTSWRMTAPIRATLDAGRGLGGRRRQRH